MGVVRRLVRGLIDRLNEAVLDPDDAVGEALEPRIVRDDHDRAALVGGELAALYCFVFLFLAAAGGGKWDVDGMLRRRAERP